MLPRSGKQKETVNVQTGKTIMRKSSLTVIAVCATLLWTGAVHAEPSPLTCTQRQVQDVNELAFELNLGQQLLCTADLTAHGCDANVCSPQAFPATGQTTPYAVGVDDGAIKAGAALSYTDNGDGTITDNNTKLMWEKKSWDGSLHDWNYYYPWSGLCQDGATLCGTSADCSAQTPTTCTATDNQGTGTIFQWVAQLNAARFAGHTDWRVPNVKELQSIVDYQYLGRAVDAAFNTSCQEGCTVDGAGSTTMCSCTQGGSYWSATTDPASSFYAFLVFFNIGNVIDFAKSDVSYARAVRSGLWGHLKKGKFTYAKAR
jgi:Protein of unknown function (DUF1566)